jgi:peptidoglycan/xylan/chitin deacetylase (PgdA/CDA1 family)
LHAINPHVTYRVPDAEKTLFLTIDDGPSSATPLILDVLRKHGVPATFFVVTDHIRSDIFGRVLADGHQIGHHMRTTVRLSAMSDEQFLTEFVLAERVLGSFTSVRLFRPPDGSISKARAGYVTSKGYEIVVGTVYPLDHWLENKTLIVKLAKTLATDGGILILHDTDSRGPRTAAVLDDLIPQLKEKGYRFALLPANAAR